jgi:hypothetical protein
MEPESVPAYFSPTSIQVPQEPGRVKSPQKLASPINNAAQMGFSGRLEMNSDREAPTKPMMAKVRRVLATLPVRSVSWHQPGATFITASKLAMF